MDKINRLEEAARLLISARQVLRDAGEHSHAGMCTDLIDDVLTDRDSAKARLMLEAKESK